jgi:hypothetical protein
MAAHPDRIPPEEAAYRLRALAGCSILPALLVSLVGESAEHLDEIGCPVLLVWPTGDRVLPKAQFAPSLLSALPDAELLEPSDVAHVPMYDAPELIARIILDFARAHPGTPAALTTSPVVQWPAASLKRARPKHRSIAGGERKEPSVEHHHRRPGELDTGHASRGVQSPWAVIGRDCSDRSAGSRQARRPRVELTGCSSNATETPSLQICPPRAVVGAL